jgi:ubiquinone/menaquinone biosynthesis C-methylase UbiE
MNAITSSPKASLRTILSDVGFLRQLLRMFVLMGDDVRPIVQKPIIAAFIQKSPSKSALDAGCGRGMYTRILLKHAEKITALDYSAEHIEAQRRRLGHLPQLSLHVGSADNLPFPDAQFDLVTHCEVLEHIHDDRRVLSEIYRVLQPGGRLVISVPVPPAPIDDKEHVRDGYTREQITELLQAAGFEVGQHQYCLFDWSKRIIQLQAWWGENMKFPLPAIVLLPVYWERLTSAFINPGNLPYDIVLEARKP